MVILWCVTRLYLLALKTQQLTPPLFCVYTLFPTRSPSHPSTCTQAPYYPHACQFACNRSATDRSTTGPSATGPLSTHHLNPSTPIRTQAHPHLCAFSFKMIIVDHHLHISRLYHFHCYYWLHTSHICHLPYTHPTHPSASTPIHMCRPIRTNSSNPLMSHSSCIDHYIHISSLHHFFFTSAASTATTHNCTCR